MEYQSITHRFQLRIQELAEFKEVKAKSKHLILRKKDYFYYYLNYNAFYGENPTGIPEYPPIISKVTRGKIHKDFSLDERKLLREKNRQEEKKYLENLKKWEADCIYSNEGREILKNIFSFFLKRSFNIFRSAIRENNLPAHIEPQLIKVFIEIGESADFSQESLDNLVVYRKMLRLCYNELKYKEFKRNLREQEEIAFQEELDRQEYQQFKDENYSWEDSYRDGGGGDEWSDSSEFW